MSKLLEVLARAQDIHDTVIKIDRALIGLSVWFHIILFGLERMAVDRCHQRFHTYRHTLRKHATNRTS